MEIPINDYMRLCAAVKKQGEIIQKLVKEVEALQDKLTSKTPFFGSPFRTWMLKRIGDLGISQEDVAKYCGVSSGCVSHWTTGISLPREKNFARLCEVLQTDRRLVEKLCRNEEVFRQ